VTYAVKASDDIVNLETDEVQPSIQPPRTFQPSRVTQPNRSGSRAGSPRGGSLTYATEAWL
jgi:hypothetical protein